MCCSLTVSPVIPGHLFLPFPTVSIHCISLSNNRCYSESSFSLFTSAPHATFIGAASTHSATIILSCRQDSIPAWACFSRCTQPYDSFTNQVLNILLHACSPRNTFLFRSTLAAKNVYFPGCRTPPLPSLHDFHCNRNVAVLITQQTKILFDLLLLFLVPLWNQRNDYQENL